MHGINCENIKMCYSYGYSEDGVEKLGDVPNS